MAAAQSKLVLLLMDGVMLMSMYVCAFVCMHVYVLHVCMYVCVWVSKRDVCKALVLPICCMVLRHKL